jgi:hypothetical protein
MECLEILFYTFVFFAITRLALFYYLSRSN